MENKKKTKKKPQKKSIENKNPKFSIYTSVAI
jgi:hypothetical protein